MAQVSKKINVIINTLLTFSILFLYFLLLNSQYSSYNLDSSEEKVKEVSLQTSEYESAAKSNILQLSKNNLKVKNAIEILKVNLYRELTLDLDLESAYSNLKEDHNLIENHEELQNISHTIRPKNRTISDLITNLDRKNVLIASTFRSGSSFLGDLINHYPGTFYDYEPLYEFPGIRNKTAAIKLIEDIFKCNFKSEDIKSHFKILSIYGDFFERNKRLSNVCGKIFSSHEPCLSSMFYKKTCTVLPIHLIKTVRLRIKETEKFLKEADIHNFKLVALFRDPRGTMNSRSNLEWCKADNCANIEKVCQQLSEDVKATFDLAKKYPKNVYLVRYEDLALDPYTIVEEMLTFLGLPMKPQIQRFIESHMKKSESNEFNVSDEDYKNKFSTFRDSNSTVFAWKCSLEWSSIAEIQQYCQKPMEQLGYKIIEEEPELLIKNRNFIKFN